MVVRIKSCGMHWSSGVRLGFRYSKIINNINGPLFRSL